MPPLEQLGLWRQLQVAAIEPERAEMGALWALMEAAIERVPEAKRLEVAGEAIYQMALILEGKSELLTTVLAACPDGEEAVEAVEELFAGLLLQRTATPDYETLVTPRQKYKRVLPSRKPAATDTLVAEVTKQQVLSLREALNVAHPEDVSEWGRRIEGWFEQHPEVKRTRLRSLQEPLALSLIELWLGMLLCANLFRWESIDDGFYAHDVWIYYRERNSW